MKNLVVIEGRAGGAAPAPSAPVVRRAAAGRYGSLRSLISRAPRPRVMKLNAQRMRTSRRFWNPIK